MTEREAFAAQFARIDLPATVGIQDLFRHLANDLARTEAIAAEAAAAFEQRRKVLVLTERTEHLEAIHLALTAQAQPPFVLHGRMSKKQRAAVISAMGYRVGVDAAQRPIWK